MAATKNRSVWASMIDSLEGDKIVWMIVFFLIMASVLAISSSTSLLALQSDTSRMSFAMEQVIISVVGLALILLIYKFMNVGILRFFSKFGFIVSAFLLLYLDSHFQGIPFFRPMYINRAWRSISVFGVQLQVFEFVKVMMVMYLAWAMNELKLGRTEMAGKLSAFKHLKFLGTDEGKFMFYIALPMVLVVVLEMMGSNSSAIFLALVMGATLIIGGVKWKYLLHIIIAGLAALMLVFALEKITGWSALERVTTLVSRVTDFKDDPLERLRKETPGTIAFQEVLDDTMQPMSAKVAISEGGFWGKGPGKSTQRYKVAVMYEDFMFSFIVEEYGIIGAIIILMLYGSLLARGSLIVRSCDNHFAKTAVGGLVVLISGQAMLHILVNVDLIPMTGQNLPIVSHGNSSFLAFSLAFGVILSISRMAKKKIDKETAKSQETPIIVTEDDIRDRLGDLDSMED